MAKKLTGKWKNPTGRATVPYRGGATFEGIHRFGFSMGVEIFAHPHILHNFELPIKAKKHIKS
jgi:hypothetical protein